MSTIIKMAFLIAIVLVGFTLLPQFIENNTMLALIYFIGGVSALILFAWKTLVK